jgi:WD40 repeat protein
VDSIGGLKTFTSPHIALSPDGAWIAALSEQDRVSIWHVASKRRAFDLRPEQGSVWSLAWDPSGTKLAVGQSAGSLAIWNLPKIQRKLAEFGLQWHEEAPGAPRAGLESVTAR